MLVLVVCSLARGQFDNLATNHDGSVALFSFADPSSVTPGGTHSRVWRVTIADPPHIFAARPEEQPVIPPAGGTVFSNYFQLSVAGLSADGTVAAVNGSRQCFGRGCITAALNQFEVLNLPVRRDIVLSGAGTMSPQARYAFIVRKEGLYNGPPLIVDLLTGASIEINRRVDAVEGGISDTGVAAMAASSQELYILSSRENFTAVSARGHVDSTISTINEPVIDAAGTFVLYTARSRRTLRRTLRIYDLASRTDREYLSGNGDLYHPRISLDGSRIVFVSTANFGTADPAGLPQVFIVNRDGKGFRRVTDNASGVQYAALSGNGRVIWYVSGAGHLIRHEIETGAAMEKIGRTLRVHGSMAPVAAGSLATLGGTGFGPDVRVFIGDLPAPVLAVQPQELTVQIPWGLLGYQSVRVERDGDRSRWETQPVAQLFAAETAPRVFTTPTVAGDVILAAHEDWRGLVTMDDPVRPGEIVHMYGTGLGPVDPPVRLGDPSPQQPPARATGQFKCVTYAADNRAVDVPVIFGGLAPDMIGIYQISVQIPRESFRSLISVGCGDASGWLPVVGP